MPEIRSYQDRTLTLPQVEAVCALFQRVWPSGDFSLESAAVAFRQREHRVKVERRRVRYILWERKRALAHALTFPRTVITESGELEVLALAGVCVSPERQGEGLGKQIVEHALQRVVSGEFRFSLFQTGVDGFYSRLGARQVNNRFVNRLDSRNPTANPWWDTFVMVYPGNADWPDGEIDLNGSAF